MQNFGRIGVIAELRVSGPDYRQELMMKCCYVFLALLMCGQVLRAASAEDKKDLGVQLAENPPMQVVSKTPPAPAGD